MQLERLTFPFTIATYFAYIDSYHINIPSKRGNESHVLTLDYIDV